MTLAEQLFLFHLPPAAPPPKTRHLMVGSRIVEYRLAYGRRRLSMTVDERGLRVGAPNRATLAEIEGFVRQHSDWLLDKLDAHADRRSQRQTSLHDGAAIPLLGGAATVRVVAGANRVGWEGDHLILAARPGADLGSLARRGLQRRAGDLFAERLALFAARMGRPLPPLRLSAARTRWGSCSRASGIRLNWRLIHLPLELVDYVICHELAHLVEMNHSPRFWAVVENLYPDWRAARRALKSHSASLPLV